MTSLPDLRKVTSLSELRKVTSLPDLRKVTSLSELRNVTSLPDLRKVTPLPELRKRVLCQSNCNHGPYKLHFLIYKMLCVMCFLWIFLLLLMLLLYYYYYYYIDIIVILECTMYASVGKKELAKEGKSMRKRNKTAPNNELQCKLAQA